MTMCTPEFWIKDASGNDVLRIRSLGIEYEVLTLDSEKQIGKITKQWTNLVQEIFTDADNFGVTFPMDLDVKVKATLLGAVFLIHIMYFEKNN